MLNSINSDLIRGHIDTIILSVLREGDRYGYDILGEIEKKSGGQYTLKQPTLYSCLKRLENQGFIYKYWGTETNGGRRTYYSLTEMGKELFMKNKDEWEHSRGIIDMLISSSGVPVRPYILEPITDEKSSEKPRNESDRAEQCENEQTAAEETNTDGSQAEESTISADEENAVECEKITATQPENTAAADDVEKNVETDELAESIYSDMLAEKEKDRILEESDVTSESEMCNAPDKLLGVSYADRIRTDEPAPNENAPRDETPEPDDDYASENYFKDYDGEDETYEGEEIEIVDSGNESSVSSVTMTEYVSPADAVINDNREAYRVGNPLAESTSITEDSENTDTSEEKTSVEEERTDYGFRSYDGADISEESRRNLIVQREYRNVIRALLRGEYKGSEIYVPDETTHAAAATETDTAASRYETAAFRADSTQADFSNVIMAVRNMGDDVRIRTHNSNTDKEYNSAYQYYSNKLLLYKYGIIFLLMAAEILIPYLIIKFAANINMEYEVLTLVLSTTGAAILPIYAVIANVIDPFKRKRYSFSMKNSMLFRIAVFLLLLVLIYALNVVLFMDIAFEAEYAFSLITPALLATNILVSPLLFQTLYDTKKFNVEN